MAITKTVVDVNNGQFGAAAGGNNPWTKSDVLDALETVFQTLGMNGGTQTNGVPVMVESPSTLSYNDTEEPITTNNTSNFGKCGGTTPTLLTGKTRYFKVSNNGTLFFLQDSIILWVPSIFVNKALLKLSIMY